MTITVEKLAGEWMKDPAFKAEYDALGPEFELAEALIKARKHAGLSQAQVAEKMGTKQPTIARLESGRSSPTFATLRNFGEAVGHRLVVDFEPQQVAASGHTQRVGSPSPAVRATGRGASAAVIGTSATVVRARRPTAGR